MPQTWSEIKTNPTKRVQLASAFRGRWTLHARPSQIEPDGDWPIWFIRSGRGWGKTRTACETVRKWVNDGRYKLIHFVARTAADARDTMVLGESGIITCCATDTHNRPTYHPSGRCITWPNGARVLLFSAKEPDQLRGPQCEAYWADEIAHWQYDQLAWDMMQMGARLGRHVRGIVTSTPRPTKLVKHIMSLPGVKITTGSTYENAKNLAENFTSEIRQRYEGSRLGRQEIYGEILDDNPGALWNRKWFDDNRTIKLPDGVHLSRIVVGLDPTCSADGDEAGIIAAAKAGGEFYILDDASLNGSPLEWARAAITAYHKMKADRLIYEANQGGDMVAQTLRTVDREIPLKAVHASRGKSARAEPIASLYEQGRVHHIGNFSLLEDECCEWNPDESNQSPNRLDALVWALTELSTKSEPRKARMT